MFNLHERIYRGKEFQNILREKDIVICGAGALGSNLALELCRHGLRNLFVIDNDRVTEHNIGTQAYRGIDVGSLKVNALRDIIYDITGEINLEILDKRLEKSNVRKILSIPDLVIDTFDNMESREIIRTYCWNNNFPCVHAGMATDFSEVTWNQYYVSPQNTLDPDVCEYPLARNLVMMTVVLLSEAVIQYLLNGIRVNYTLSFRNDGDMILNKW